MTPDDNSDAGSTPSTKEKPDPQGLTQRQIDYVNKQIAETEKKKAREEAKKVFSKMDHQEALDTLQQENEQLKEQQKLALLKQFNEDEQEEFKDRSISELQLLLDYKAKHLRKGIQRSTPTGASDKRTSTKMTPGSIGSYDPITREWKPS